MYKICSRCKTEKSLSSYYKYTKGKFGVRAECKDCLKKYFDKRKDKTKQYNKQYRIVKKQKLSDYEKTVRRRFVNYRKDAKKRKLEFKLTESEFDNITKLNCFYCGQNGQDGYVGIDRLDNKLGYFVGNCVSCCTNCNLAKNDLTQDDFRDMIVRIYNYYVKVNKYD